MIDWMLQRWASLSTAQMVLGMSLLLVGVICSLAVVTIAIVKLPDTYFQLAHPREFWAGRHPVVRIVGLVAKNLLGGMLVVLGILLSVPGVPGQGFLTILLGVMLLDFPGKRNFELKIVSRPVVMRNINRLRGRFGKSPLLLD